MYKALSRSLLSALPITALAMTTTLANAAFGPPAFASAEESTPNYWGFIDSSGKLAIEPKFLSVSDFHEGLAAVQISVKDGDASTSEKWGFIDKSGKMAIEAQFDEVHAFSEGLAAARQGKWGFIDKSGKFVIEPQFDDADRFSEGLAPAAISTLRWGFIDKSGHFKIEPNFKSAQPFADKRAAVLFGDGSNSYSFHMTEDTYDVRGGMWNYIDKEGKIVIDSRFDAAGLFNQGLAPAAVGSNQGTKQPDKWGFINPDGYLTIKPQFNSVHAPSEECAAVQFGTWKKIGKGHRSWIPGKWGYINLKGTTLIEPQYQGADRFSEGLASVLIDQKYGYINKKGKMVIEPKYRATGEFHEQLAPVQP